MYSLITHMCTEDIYIDMVISIHRRRRRLINFEINWLVHSAYIHHSSTRTDDEEMAPSNILANTRRVFQFRLLTF